MRKMISFAVKETIPCICCTKELDPGDKHTSRVSPARKLKNPGRFIPKGQLVKLDLWDDISEEARICRQCHIKLARIDSSEKSTASLRDEFKREICTISPNLNRDKGKKGNLVNLDFPERQLCETLQPIGEALFKGTYKDIANTILNTPKIYQNIEELFLKRISLECEHICGRKNPSILRTTKGATINNLTFDKVHDELLLRTPLLTKILKATTIKNEQDEKSKFWLPTICITASVLLKNRCVHMNGFQILINTILQHSSFTVSMST